MMTDLPSDKRQLYAMAIEFEKIQRDCPLFTEWIAESQRQTMVECEESAVADYRLKQLGAHKDLRTISEAIANPPQVDPFNDGQPGMGTR